MDRFLSFLLIVSALAAALVRSQEYLDISWDFGDNELTSGWGNATSDETNILVSAKAGELKCIITGFSPKLDSPSLFMQLSRRHVLITRLAYTGSATSARMLLRSGGAPSPSSNLVFGTQHWSARQPVVAISDTGSPLTGFDRSNAVDGDPQTYYFSNSTRPAVITFDLGDFRTISGIRILSLGTTSSPRRCVVQRSITSGVGPFETLSSFTLSQNGSTSLPNSATGPSGQITEQRIRDFEGFARYWRLIMLDNHGGSGIGVREVVFDGFDDSVTPVPMTLNNDGLYTNYYLPIGTYLQGSLLRMRFELVYPETIQIQPYLKSKFFKETMSIDYIRIVRAPEIWRVRGCTDKYYEDASYQNAFYNVTTQIEVVNGNLPIHSFVKNTLSLPYATTYDCPFGGGIDIAVDGYNFGPHVNIFIGGNSCPIISNTVDDIEGRLRHVVCRLPMGSSGLKTVRIENAVHPGLFHEVPSLSYRVAPPVPDPPAITNIGAYRMDLVWRPPGNEFDQMTITGYKILWFQPKFPSRISNVTVSNITTTSIRGLEPATEYVFAIAAVSEGRERALLPTDLYGRRNFVDDATVGTFSVFTNITATVLFDFDFNFFSANNTLNASGSTPSSSVGPTGNYGSEGSYGLVLVGSANVQNCNVSSTCCDGYNATVGLSSCGTLPTVCAVLPANMLAYDFVEDGVTRRGVPTNLEYSNGAPAEIRILTLDQLIANKGAELPTSRCGPALRLTPSSARHSGAAWYRRKMDVREGFDTYIRFQISNPSQKCDRQDDVNTYCRSRGADGLAFLIQNVAPDALGNAGSGLGYEGIFNSLAVELDTYYNFDQIDSYENHIAVMTEGFRFNITANHSRALATSNRAPDLTDGPHTLRIRYDPNFNIGAVPHPSFQVNGFTTWFLNNGDYKNGGEGDWGVGFGLLYVYIDDMYSPIITTPINLGATLKLDEGRAYVGLTSATGDEYWQAHDILSWQFNSLFIDEKYTPPTRVNNQGDHQCVNETECVHRVDYDHYMRTNNIWGPGADSTEGWQDGSEGYCAFC